MAFWKSVAFITGETGIGARDKVCRLATHLRNDTFCMNCPGIINYPQIAAREKRKHQRQFDKRLSLFT